MTDTIEFEVACLRSRKSRKAIAKSIGMSHTSLSYKANNRSEWTASEILKLKKCLGLTGSDIVRIFFAEGGENLSPKCAKNEEPKKDEQVETTQENVPEN